MSSNAVQTKKLVSVFPSECWKEDVILRFRAPLQHLSTQVILCDLCLNTAFAESYCCSVQSQANHSVIGQVAREQDACCAVSTLVAHIQLRHSFSVSRFAKPCLRQSIFDVSWPHFCTVTGRILAAQSGYILKCEH